MSGINKNELFSDVYKIINNIILDTHKNEIITKNLQYCDYILLNDNKQYYYPLTLCIGGAGFIQYNLIFYKENLVDNIELKSLDYDISFSLNISFNDKKIINNIISEFEKIYVVNMNNYEFDDTINKNNFKLTYYKNTNRIHFRMECCTNKPLFSKNSKIFHIAEFSLWFNGKVSDNFTINDFMKKPLILYKNKNVYYYLLPLELLMKTLLYAIVDFFERRNYYKCIKYIERALFIKKCNKLFIDKKENNKALIQIFSSYKNKIKRKCKIINDYPFILSYELSKINNNGIIKCLYKLLRLDNHKKYIGLINKFKKECDNENNYLTENSEITIEDTENDE